MIELCSPQELSCPELIEEARREVTRFLRHEPSEHACAFELFRRAIVQQDEQAWVGLYDLYRALVSSWIMRRAHSLSQEDLAALVNESFARLARAIAPHRFERFHAVQEVLTYLKRCAGSAFADYRRAQEHEQRDDYLLSIDQEPMTADPADEVAQRLVAQEIRQVIEREVSNPEERLILWAICAGGLTPRELRERYPQLFASVADIYRIKRNVLERLRRNRRLQALWTPPQKASIPLCMTSTR